MGEHKPEEYYNNMDELDGEGDLGQLLYNAATSSKKLLKNCFRCRGLVLTVVLLVAGLVGDLVYLHVRYGRSSDLNCGVKRLVIQQECFALALPNKARRQTPTGLAEVELDVREYGKKKVSNIVPFQAVPKITVVSSCVGFDFCDTAENNFRKYTECHGYALEFNRKPIDSSRSAHWTKIPLIEKQLNAGSDFVFWMDADSLFMEMSLSIETFITNSGTSLWVEADLNTGHFLFRNTPWSRAFLKEWYDTYPSPLPWNDQSSLMWVLGGRHPECRQNLAATGLACYAVVSHEFRSQVTVLDRRIVSSYFWEYQVGDFIVHFPGMEDKKKALMTKYGGEACLYGIRMEDC